MMKTGRESRPWKRYVIGIISVILLVNIFSMIFWVNANDDEIQKTPKILVRNEESIQIQNKNIQKVETNPPIVSNNETKPPRYFWESSGDTSFIEISENRWAEFQGDQPKFYYKMVKSTAISVELHDEDRGIYIQLDDNNARYKKLKTDTYSTIFHGYWKVFRGKIRTGRSPIGNYEDKMPPRPYIEGKLSEQTIAIMFAAYQDPLCGNSIYEAFKYAEYPERISVIVIQQRGEDEKDCVDDYCELAEGDNLPCYRDKVKSEVVTLDYARGVMPARFRQHLLIEDQEFCLQGDSHSAFEQNWDTMVLEDWLTAENEMAMITTYPNRANDRHKQQNSPIRCSTVWTGNVVGGGVSSRNVPIPKTPMLSPFFGAGLSFSKCHANFNVPYDPYMSELFKGEEFNRAIRLFTSGYDMYGLKRNFLYHFYDSDERPKNRSQKRLRGFFNQAKKFKAQMQSATELRWLAVLGMTLQGKLSEATMENADMFGIGDKRSIDVYQEFSKVNLTEKTEVSLCDSIGRLKWKSYDFDPDNFYPSGNGCPFKLSKDIRRYCCTTLEQVRESTSKFLALSNDQAGQKLVDSPPVEFSGKPIISPLNTAARRVCQHKQKT